MSASHKDFKSNETAAKLQWYEVVAPTANLEQGDFFDNFPIITSPIPDIDIKELNDGKTVEAAAVCNLFNVVLMTQSCDLRAFSDDATVILCPRYDLSRAKKPTGGTLNNPDGWGKLRKGYIIGSHLLNQCYTPDHNFEYQVVDLQRIFTIPLGIVAQWALTHGPRVRLLPPYREHLAQAFARQFMRIGLPLDLPERWPYANK